MKNHAAIVIKDGDKILFIKRSMSKSTLPGAWSFPSGTQEEGENLMQTTIREAKEELDVLVDIKGEEVQTELPEFNVKLHFIPCVIKEGKPKILDEKEIAEIDWLTFPEFFQKFSDDEIGHGLIWLRKNEKAWKSLTE